MFEASTTEFPFVANLPKREKSKVGKALDVAKEMIQMSKDGLLPAPLVQAVLNVSKQRMHQLLHDDRFPGAVKYADRWYIPEASFLEFAKAEKSKGGRPRKGADVYISAAREILRK